MLMDPDSYTDGFGRRLPSDLATKPAWHRFSKAGGLRSIRLDAQGRAYELFYSDETTADFRPYRVDRIG